VLRLLLDSDAGTLTVKKNGNLLGVMVTAGLTGDICWAVACKGWGASVRGRPGGVLSAPSAKTRDSKGLRMSVAKNESIIHC
jgi:hypothetical protein